MERFQDRHIIVTGGGSGIGRATVLRLLAEAGTVHTDDVDEPGLVGTAELADAEGVGASASRPRCSTSPTSSRSRPACAPPSTASAVSTCW